MHQINVKRKTRHICVCRWVTFPMTKHVYNVDNATFVFFRKMGKKRKKSWDLIGGTSINPTCEDLDLDQLLIKL